ncbi:MAG: fumarylacetoacetate hydrolase family protein [Ilumatobacteraceae bacterium]
MRLANVDGRAALVTPDGAATVDVTGFAGFGDVFERWDELRARASDGGHEQRPIPIDPDRLGPPSPAPSQVFAIGLNYAAHAAESGMPVPEFPTTFTKFPTCLTGASAVVDLPSASVDYEVELVVVIGRRAHRVDAGSAWGHVAGLAVGQDLSERVVQMRPPAPQFSLGKSFPGFGPVGPWLVTPDELADPDDLAIACRLNGELVQASRTSDLIFSVGEIIERVSHITPMLPGDLIFTGTPSGVGVSRDPQRFLRPSDVLESTIEGVGTIVTRCR